MLHELLLALLGFTGDFVLDSSSSSSARRRSAPGEAGGAGDADVGPAFRLPPTSPSSSRPRGALLKGSYLWAFIIGNLTVLQPSLVI